MRTEDELEARTTEKIRLRFPASADLVALARFTAGVIATRSGFDIEELQDLQLAVDELIAVHVRLDEVAEVDLEFVRTGDEVEITCRSPRPVPQGAPSPGEDTAEFSRQILDALVDEHGETLDGPQPCAWLRKSRGSHSDGV